MNERSARRRGRYLHNTQEKNIHALSGVITRDPSSQVDKTYASDRMATGIVFVSARGDKLDEVKGEWRRLHNEELNDLYCSPILCG